MCNITENHHTLLERGKIPYKKIKSVDQSDFTDKNRMGKFFRRFQILKHYNYSIIFPEYIPILESSF